MLTLPVFVLEMGGHLLGLDHLISQRTSNWIQMLLVEQNVGQSLEIAQRAYVLENGAILFSGTGADLLASDALRLAYLGV